MRAGGRASDWLHLYKRCQAAGKGLQIRIQPDELDLLIEHLRPEGLRLSISHLADRDQAEAPIRRTCRWR